LILSPLASARTRNDNPRRVRSARNLCPTSCSGGGVESGPERWGFIRFSIHPEKLMNYHYFSITIKNLQGNS
jgi:hypothetical protein